MSQNPVQLIQKRKIGYILGIIALLIVLAFLGTPGVIGESASGEGGFRGGKLARLRYESGLSEGQLGKIDPASQTMRLATFGMRGVAAAILWEKANEFKMKKDWTNFSTTLEQIARLEPHFPKVWQFQGWNTAYNVSAEFDDFRERYHWVIKGVEYLKNGISFNENIPKLYVEVGRTISQKIGRADESRQFRRLFREDDLYHGSRPVVERDNWLCGREWYLQGERTYEEGNSIDNLAESMLYVSAPMCLVDYADNLEKDGIFGEKAAKAYQDALNDWVNNYGQREFRVVTWDELTRKVPESERGKLRIRLGDLESLQKRQAEFSAQIDQLAPGIREGLYQEKLSQLSEEERQALEMKLEEMRLPRERILHDMAVKQLQIPDRHVTDRMKVTDSLKGKPLEQALDLVRESEALDPMVRQIQTDRGTINYNYWKLHSRVEQHPAALEAQERIWEARRAAKQSDVAASDLFLQGFAAWRKVFDDPDPEMVAVRTDDQYFSDWYEDIEAYQKFLASMDMDDEFPADFPLAEVLEWSADQERIRAAAMEAERQRTQQDPNRPI